MPQKELRNFISLDLEMNQPSNSIIQVGAVVGNLQTGEVLERYSAYTLPKEFEQINGRIVELTGITDDTLAKHGIPLLQAHADLIALKNKYNCVPTPIVWGGGDSQLLLKQLSPDITEDTFCFGRRWYDIKTVFQFYCMSNGTNHQSGLAKSMTKIGLKFKGRKHNALDDACNTFLLAHELTKRLNSP